MSKRKNGEGTWGKKIIKGYTYTFYRDADGKYTYGKTQKEVKEKLEKKKKETISINQKTTFGEYIMYWLETKKNSIQPTTYDCYETMISSLIINRKCSLKDLQLHQINRDEFQLYLDDLATEYSRSTINKIWIIIKECVKYAEVSNEISANTTALIRLPIEAKVKVKKKEVPFLSIEDANRLYDVSSQYGNNAQIITLIMYTGMRVSEAIALKWKNVDLTNKKIYVKESAADIINREEHTDKKYISYDKETKTYDSTRTIPLPDRAIEAIQYFSQQNPKHKNEDYVCVTKNGTKMNRRNINRTLNTMAKKAKCSVENFSVHSLRHTYGSILIANGVDIKVVSQLLGHSDISTTYNIYIGILEKDKAKDVERIFNK